MMTSSAIVAHITHNIHKTVMTKLLSTIFSSMRLPNITTSRWPLSMYHSEAIRTTKVVVLIPPPVEPLPAPMNIQIMRMNKLLSCRCIKSTVLKPAVRADTAWKNAAIQLSNSDILPMV